MTPRGFGPDVGQYGDRRSDEIRITLLNLALEFVRAAAKLPGVDRIALLGSVVTAKARPKDVDVLVQVCESVDLAALGKLGRRLKGTAQARLNSGADVFLASAAGEYMGRICHYRACHPRVLCRARNCGAVPHVADDLDLVCLEAALIASPPLELFPGIVVRAPLPEDVERIIVAPLRTELNATMSCLTDEHAASGAGISRRPFL